MTIRIVPRIIQSKQNPRLKELRTALQRPGRGEADLVALEGIHLVAEALRSGVTMQTIFIAQGHEAILDQLPLPESVELLALPHELLTAAVTTETPNDSERESNFKKKLKNQFLIKSYRISEQSIS